MKSQTLKKADNETDSVRTGEFEVGRWWELTVDFDDFLEKYGDGTNAVPQKYWKIIESLSFSAEEIQGLLSFLRDPQIFNVLNDGCKFLLIVGTAGFIRVGQGGVVLVVQVRGVALHEIGWVGVH